MCIFFLLNNLIYYFQATAEDTVIAPGVESDKNEPLIKPTADNNEIKLEDINSKDDKQINYDQSDDKRNIGRWRNHDWNLQKYKPDREKRFIGRWKNRNWLNSGRKFQDIDDDFNTAVDKRADGYLDDFAYSDELLPYLYNDEGMDKRQGGRWALIHKQLNRLENSRSKSKKNAPADEYYDDDEEMEKRMDSRWLLIQSKLRDLAGRTRRSKEDDKRFVGRWKNQNWLLSQANKKLGLSESQNIDKKNIGRWKNRNWILQQYRERKSLGKYND